MAESPPEVKDWVQIIAAVKTPLGFLTLIVLVVCVLLGAFIAKGSLSATSQSIAIVGLVLLLILPAGVVAWVGLRRPEWLTGEPPKGDPAPLSPADAKVASIVENQGGDVLYGDANKSVHLDVWFSDMRPFLYQAAYYSVPMYFLDVNLNVTDWNIAFEIVYSDLIDQIRGKHVNWFIARMANYNEVFDHARKFTKDVTEKGVFPFVDTEPIDYQSADFGLVKSLKVATQINDARGDVKARRVQGDAS